MQAEGTYYDVLGVPVSILTLDEAARRIEGWAGDETGRFVCIRDVASLMAITEDPAIAPLHRDAAMITPDGMPLVVLGKLKGHPVSRVCGPDLIDFMMARSASHGTKHYFYGGQEGVAEEMARRFAEKYPGVEVVGCECPPFRPLTEEELAEACEAARIAASGADVVWIGISRPSRMCDVAEPREDDADADRCRRGVRFPRWPGAARAALDAEIGA
ncbi:MAG: WecB/TagA/CpsF family glycosyltransferase [Sphingomonadaceae bacterium]